MDEKNNWINFIPGDIVQHFKYETCTDFEKAQNKYKYVIRGTAEYTETGEELVIYQALYGEFKTYARPVGEFTSYVDREKYPDIKQVKRFELCWNNNLIVPGGTE